VKKPENPEIRQGNGGLTIPPFLVKVDRYGSVSALSRVETPLGSLVVKIAKRPLEVEFVDHGETIWHED